MKLLMTNYEFPPIGGGAGHAHQCLLDQYARYPEIQVDVLTSAPDPGLTRTEVAANITLYKIGLHKRDLHYWRKIEVLEWLAKATGPYHRLLRQSHYDLVHSFFAFPSGWFCYRSRKRLPYILSLRGSDVPGYNVRLGLDYKLLNGLFKRIWAHASAIIANSEGLCRLAREFHGDGDIRVIPNGVDTNIYSPRSGERLWSGVRLLTVCRLIERKRIDWMIRALSKLVDEGLNVSLTVAGDGNLQPSLKDLALTLGMSRRVRFMGRVCPVELPDVYQRHDIFVMTSMHEGMSNAMLEAMACGLPTVTTPCEGVDELVSPDNGIIVEPTIDDIVSGIRRLAQNSALRDQMAQAARRRAETMGWPAVAQAYLELYDKILSGSRIGINQARRTI